MRASCLNRLVTLAYLLAMPGLAQASIIGFGDFSGFTINQTDHNLAPTLFPAAGIASKIELTNSAASEARSIFYDTPQTISHFTASFTYQAIGNFDDGGGTCLWIENSPQGVNAITPAYDFWGYGGATGFFPNSAGVVLDLASPILIPGTQTALYIHATGDGGPTKPVNLLSGNPISVTLSYNGSHLSETLTDLTTGNSHSTQYSTSFNLPTVVGGSTALIGFGAVNAVTGNEQFISNFQFNAVPEPSTFALLVTALVLPLARLLRRRAT